MTTGEIAKETNLSESTLRYYEKNGLIKVSHDVNGRRDYDEHDIEWIKFIQHLKDTGMPLKDIQHYSDLRYLGENTMPERLKILQAHRKYMLDQQLKWEEYLQNLDSKINFYKKSINTSKTN